MPGIRLTLCFRRLSRPSSTVRHHRLNFSSRAEPLVRSESLAAPHVGHIKILKLDRPESRNAISRRLLADLAAEISSLECSPTGLRALIIASNVDGIFCAGADLKERITFTLDETRQFLGDLRRLLSTISTLPIPTISAINGAALGGGLELALATTFRVAASSAKLGLPETRLGIVPGAGGTYRLPALVGPQKAMHMILTGHIMTALEAQDIGLVDRVVIPDHEIDVRTATLTQAKSLAEQICSGGPVAVEQALKAVKAWRSQSEEFENAAYEITLNTEDRTSALKAFREKKLARFSGR